MTRLLSKITHDVYDRYSAELACHFSKTTLLFPTGIGRTREWEWIDRKVAWIHGNQSKSGTAIGVPLNRDAVEILRLLQELGG